MSLLLSDAFKKFLKYIENWFKCYKARRTVFDKKKKHVGSFGLTLAMWTTQFQKV